MRLKVENSPKISEWRKVGIYYFITWQKMIVVVTCTLPRSLPMCHKYDSFVSRG